MAGLGLTGSAKINSETTPAAGRGVVLLAVLQGQASERRSTPKRAAPARGLERIVQMLGARLFTVQVAQQHTRVCAAGLHCVNYSFL